MQTYKISLLNIVFTIMYFIALPAIAGESVRLQLKWTHQFQFAGYYAAQKQGYYRDAGLDVEIIEGSQGKDSSQIVTQGKAEYGVGNTSLLLNRNSGDPLVVLAVIFQHSPDILLTIKNNSAQNIHDLENKRLHIEPLADELTAYLNHEGIPLSKFNLVKYKNKVQKLIAGKVDVISAYSTIEPYFLEKKNIAYNLFSPRSVGIDFYGDNLFTTEEEIKQHPERARKFRYASLQGWSYALKHQQEMIDYILNKYPDRKEPGALAYEAKKMQKLIHSGMVEIGYMLTGRWRHIANTYTDLGMLPKNISLDGFLYNTKQTQDYFWFYIVFSITLFVLLIILLVNARFSILNKKLLQLLYLRSRFSNIGESINNISHQWKQPLNELGIQLMLIEKTLENDFITEDDKSKTKKTIDKSHNILEFMANTVDVFGQLLNRNNKKSNFHPKTIIQSLLQLIEDNFRIHQITITSELDENVMINGSSTELSHILLSILNNSRDIFKERKTTSPNIHMHLYKSSGSVCIDITDNAGGITAKPIKEIFKLGFSAKQNNDSGIGLYIAKQLTENKFNGKIHAENLSSGAVFKISIPSVSQNQ
ncbi:MAG: ABC transporter substrate-binding protein [Gammaproteobacteria bacterium]|nr:ABC transporter substrate-binding protein [Gammaproteobacteria bacterium]